MYVKGMVATAKKAGIATEKSERSKVESGSIMKIPTMMSAGAAAMLGIIRKTGEKNNVSRKSRPVLQAVRPVRPPAAIPAALSAP